MIFLFRAVLPTEGKKHSDKSNWDTDDPLSGVIGKHKKKQETRQTCERNAETYSPVNHQIKDPNHEIQESQHFSPLRPNDLSQAAD